VVLQIKDAHQIYLRDMKLSVRFGQIVENHRMTPMTCCMAACAAN
jgi:hypothetical protein